MSEELFRLCLIRPPLRPNPRYAPIPLAQDSDFQVKLGSAVSSNPNDPRQGLENAANQYVASAEFAGINAVDANDVSLEKASKAISDLIEGKRAATTSGPAGTSTTGEVVAANHGTLTEQIEVALSLPDLSAVPAWFDHLAKRLKDSLVALRMLGFESDTGTVAILTLRLRTIEVVRKAVADPNFPLDALDLQKYSLRPVVAPTFAELKSILSTATARQEAERAAEAARVAAQAKIDSLFIQRQRFVNALDDIIRLPNSLRTTIKPKPFAPVAPPVDLTHVALAARHQDLIQNLANLTLKSFERGLQSPIVVRSLGENAAASRAETHDTALAQASAIVNPLVNMSKTLLDTFGQVAFQPPPPPALPETQEVPFKLLPTAVSSLRNDTLSVFKDLSIRLDEKPVDVNVANLRSALRDNAQQLDLTYKPYVSNIAKVRSVGAMRVQYQKPAVSAWYGDFLAGLKAPILPAPRFLLPRLTGRVNVLGVADLLVVKQQLIRYEGGDVAYIENVLKGETRSREVNTSTVEETETTTELETTESQETDTTTAERFEVSHESANTIKEDASVKAGVTVSASYGPTVSVSANASFSNDRSNTEATKEASRYSKDVTAKAVDKITKRMLQRIVRKIRTETSTKDLHEFKNTSGPDSSHIAGVYQWQNKIYEAQTWNYGKRTMLDFMIPEPGAFYLDKQTDPNDATDTLVMVPSFTALPESLDVKTYTQYLVQYNSTASYAAGKDEPHSKADKIVIPAGFMVTGISVTATGVSQLDKNQNWVMVTCGSFQWGWDPKKAVIGTVTVTTDYIFFKDKTTTKIIGQGALSGVGTADEADITKEQGEIPWSVTAAYMDNFAVTIELFLDRTDEALRNWQNTTWAKIKAASNKMIADQNAAIDAAKFNSAFQGRNPDKNAAIIRNEIKKNCISIMADSHFDEYGAVQPSRTLQQPGNLPMSEIDLDKAFQQGPYVRFFEQAFEWQEMTWILYPYFWGRKDHWYRRVDYQDEDPEFEKFIQAGYARANVPVRPGFEGALEHFLATGKVWMGGPLPGISSPLFLPIAAEIQESLGKGAEQPTKYGDPWEVKVPTNLIRLRRDDLAPEWIKDKITGEYKAVPDSADSAMRASEARKIGAPPLAATEKPAANNIATTGASQPAATEKTAPHTTPSIGASQPTGTGETATSETPNRGTSQPTSGERSGSSNTLNTDPVVVEAEPKPAT
ncbi:uncharacterized protein AB675_8463 [Cyphellophora attinorum]|uniref:Uncharacterized protein n=1 Tax=Cyphellophora attinorum TaxID=1664694 RepID=A0A0N0NQZ0_9EURO|nr:uncharacterized protein AB675_8463 [Phialophora attinorum]KPI44229.1 hypothetical protein AB675_8463 [Phialophora attinorum]